MRCCTRSERRKIEKLLLVHSKIDLDVDERGHGFAVFHRWFEAVPLDGLECFFVKTHAEGTSDSRILRVTVGIHDDGDDADSLILLAAGFIGELRSRREDGNRLGDASNSWRVYRSAETMFNPRAVARPIVWTIATVGPRAEP
jgi:hypothetical protein